MLLLVFEKYNNLQKYLLIKINSKFIENVIRSKYLNLNKEKRDFLLRNKKR